MTSEIEVSDFVMMSDITEETMMNMLKERFNNDKIYVNFLKLSFIYIILYYTKLIKNLFISLYIYTFIHVYI